MMKTVTRSIGGTSYRVTQFGVGQGLPLLVKLAKLLGPSLAASLKGLGGKSLKQGQDVLDLPVGVLGDAVLELAERLQEETVVALVHQLAESTQVSKGSDRGGEKWVPLTDELELHWAGNYLNMLKWLAFGLEVNYASFFGGQGGIGSLLAALREKGESPSPTGSTGPSGGSLPPSASTPA
jgi:hypothetical protein